MQGKGPSAETVSSCSCYSSTSLFEDNVLFNVTFTQSLAVKVESQELMPLDNQRQLLLQSFSKKEKKQ